MRVVLLTAPEAFQAARQHVYPLTLHIVVKKGVTPPSQSVGNELSFVQLFSIKVKQALLNKSFSLRPNSFLLRTWGLMSSEGLIFINGLSIKKQARPLRRRWQHSYAHAGVVINNSSKQSQSCISVITSPGEECHWIRGRGLRGHADRGR